MSPDDDISDDAKRVLFALAELQYDEMDRTGLPLDDCWIPDWQVMEKVNEDLKLPLDDIVDRIRKKYPDY